MWRAGGTDWHALCSLRLCATLVVEHERSETQKIARTEIMHGFDPEGVCGGVAGTTRRPDRGAALLLRGAGKKRKRVCFAAVT